jgi:DegV family protein with EDD domain
MMGIITDSRCDIPQALIDQYKIIVVSHITIWGEEEFCDRVELSPRVFYERFNVDMQRPTTSQASVEDFLGAIHQAISQGATEAIILTVSSAMSSAYDMPRQSAERASIPITLIDSKGPRCS